MPVYIVTGAYKENGDESVLELTAWDQAGAAAQASKKGVLVTSIIPAAEEKQNVEHDVEFGYSADEYLSPEQHSVVLQRLQLQYIKRIHFWAKFFGVGAILTTLLGFLALLANFK